MPTYLVAILGFALLSLALYAGVGVGHISILIITGLGLLLALLWGGSCGRQSLLFSDSLLLELMKKVFVEFDGLFLNCEFKGQLQILSHLRSVGLLCGDVGGQFGKRGIDNPGAVQRLVEDQRGSRENSQFVGLEEHDGKVAVLRSLATISVWLCVGTVDSLGRNRTGVQ